MVGEKMKTIAVLINSRVEGNVNCGVLNLLKSIAEQTKYLDQIEVLIKFDSCDTQAPDVIDQIKKIPVDTKCIIEPRGRGYIDIHHGYNRLLMHVSPDAELIGAMADDFLVYPGWEESMLPLMRDRAEKDLYIIHHRPHPPTCRDNYETEKFCMNYPMFEDMEHLFIVDESPFWSRELLFTTTWLGGGLSFTDGWTIALEYVLWQRYKLNITRFTDALRIHRVTHPEVDTRISPRWNTDRRVNFEYVASPYFREIVEHQARNIYLTLKGREI
jgi:hypothetical protein